MMPPPLEDRLDDLAAGVHAPPTSDARAAIGTRARVLRRRRRALAAGSGVLAALAVIGAVAVTRASTPDESTVAADGDADLPALAIALDGWEVELAEDTVGGDAGGAGDGSVQTFRSPEDPAGLNVVLRHQSASDALAVEPGDDEVTVGDDPGLLREDDAGGIVLEWQHPGVDAVARIEASGLSRAEVLEFAGGLDARDDAISYPPEPGDTFGFDQTATVRGLVERPATIRHVVQTDGIARAEVTIATADRDQFEAILDDLRSTGPSEDVTVMGRTGVLVSRPEDQLWQVAWQPSEGTVARMVVLGVDRAGADAVMAAVQVLGEEEWDALVRDLPTAVETGTVDSLGP